MSILFSISFSILVILLVLPFACKWYLTKYLPAWSELVDILKNGGKEN